MFFSFKPQPTSSRLVTSSLSHATERIPELFPAQGSITEWEMIRTVSQETHCCHQKLSVTSNRPVTLCVEHLFHWTSSTRIYYSCSPSVLGHKDIPRELLRDLEIRKSICGEFRCLIPKFAAPFEDFLRSSSGLGTIPLDRDRDRLLQITSRTLTKVSLEMYCAKSLREIVIQICLGGQRCSRWAGN